MRAAASRSLKRTDRPPAPSTAAKSWPIACSFLGWMHAEAFLAANHRRYVMQERFFSPGMDVGIGINLLTGEALVQGVTGVVTPLDAAGQNIQSRIIRVEDISSLHTALGVDVSASGSY